MKNSSKKEEAHNQGKRNMAKYLDRVSVKSTADKTTNFNSTNSTALMNIERSKIVPIIIKQLRGVTAETRISDKFPSSLKVNG